jgi:hypothetical protein
VRKQGDDARCAVRFHGGPVTSGDLELRRARILRGKHEGNITVFDGGELTVDGMVTGRIRVCRGGAVRIRGMAGSSVEVEEGALLLMDGVVGGALHVQAGGRAEITGTVNSIVQQDPGAAVVRHPGARIAGSLVA